MSSARRRIQEGALRLFTERGVTQVTVSELAEAAGVARGTIYNHYPDISALFEQVATQLTDEMTARIESTLADTRDPAQRLANGIRFFVRRAHEEPIWGRFIVRFAISTPTLRAVLQGDPSKDLMRGVELGRLRLRGEQVASALAMLSGSVLAAMTLVIEGHRTWRDAASETAELFLRALGVPAKEARSLAVSELPPLRASADD